MTKAQSAFARMLTTAFVMTVFGNASAMKLATNLYFHSDYGSHNVYKDLIKDHARQFRALPVSEPETSNKANDSIDYHAHFDERGYPYEVPFTVGGTQYRVFSTMLYDALIPGLRREGTFTLLFEGTGEIYLARSGSETYVGNGGESRYEIEITFNQRTVNSVGIPTTDGIYLGVTRSDRNDPIRNIRLIYPDDNGGTGFVDTYESDPWLPEIYEQLAPFSLIRFMDWGRTNYNTWTVWSDRTPPDFFSYCTFARKNLPFLAVPYEDMIDLCNRLNKDAWICVPHLADKNFQHQLATLIKNALKPSLKCYVEWSNETWNWNFSQAQYAKNTGKSLGLSDKDGPAMQLYTAYAAVRLFGVFEDVFAGERDRIVTVLGSRHRFPDHSQALVDALADATINPDDVKPDALAIAHYFGGTIPGSVDDVITILKDQILPQSKTETLEHKAIADAAGMRFTSYEGGQHLKGATSTYDANNSPQMYDVYRQALSDCEGVLEHFNQYAFMSRWSSYDCWGSKHYHAQPLSEAHKYRALWDYAVQNQLFDPNALTVRKPTAAFSLMPKQANVTLSVCGNRLQAAGLTHAAPAQLFDPRGRLIATLRPAGASATARISLPAAGTLIWKAGANRGIVRSIEQ